MTTGFDTPQAAEDAYYDALEGRDADLMARVWDDSPDIACVLPMQPIVHGVQVRNMMRELLRSDVPIDIRVTHLRWVELGDVAIHYVTEHNNAGDAPPGAPGIFATNVFRRRGEAGWTMILHQNSPPPPSGPPPRR
ncbi:nuclear transport factor 2 family protein [uncultured Thiohalocapsa sp.]|jgi:hypothetical protein|uniref:YybH family protein n=1 Tax=uncultured Thiohalocapsa sp. TaxID=768990 RepID=UPI0025DA0236|nr:nuclear transport factor 2 family protein [uncultured Thiohalocapsa sp.]